MRMLKRLRPFVGSLVPAEWRGAAHRVISHVRYSGSRFYCPCCQGSVRAFLPFGVVPRNHARCPGCGSLERHRLLWLYLTNRTTLFVGNAKLLHFAPEAFISDAFKSMANLDYVSADLESPLAMLKMDITDILFRITYSTPSSAWTCSSIFPTTAAPCASSSES